MKAYTFFAIILAFITGTAGFLQAHEVRPGFLELKQVDALNYDLLWKVPAKGDQRLGLYVRLPDNCRSSEAASLFGEGAYIERRRVTCAGGLRDGIIAIDGLEATRTDVLARVEHSGGLTQTIRLTPSETEFTVLGSPGRFGVARTYFKLGVEHILLGFDHLLFVLALLFLVEGRRRLVGTITAFTVAHSLTLAAATFGWVRVPQAPVEAVIALSIMFVAAEALHRNQGRAGIAARKPWVVAFAFGLLHGLGFAGALQQVGLPQHAIPLALAFFNVGVETGQLLFVAAVFLIVSALNQMLRGRRTAAEPPLRPASAATSPAAYVIGTLSAFWLIERTYGFFV